MSECWSLQPRGSESRKLEGSDKPGLKNVMNMDFSAHGIYCLNRKQVYWIVEVRLAPEKAEK